MPRQPYRLANLLLLSLALMFGATPFSAEAGACQRSSFEKLDDYRFRILKKYERAGERLMEIEERFPALYSQIEGDFTLDVMARYFLQADKRDEFSHQRGLVDELLNDLEEVETLVDSATEMGGNLKKLGALLSESCQQAGASADIIDLADRFEGEGFALGHAEARPYYDIINDFEAELKEEQTLLRQVRNRMPEGAFRD
ncbi:hypothetical protein [Ferrimonas balearica]|uniref:hypothetical protein n=1 Tax=Ferrimonas balearica TaxID=44012 RepID=UPI001C9A0676|nr:hypothetical protein [Ferrimonas balearica]MBY5922279.1 hypothetical protein [Ferrimonas balearica]MBY5994381.1 hypothetical protein [Ferrimonas balearica]